jgi:hypothetical protein
LTWLRLVWAGLVWLGLVGVGPGRSSAALVLAVVDEGVVVLVLSLWVRGVGLVLGGAVGVEVERGREVVEGVGPGVGRRRMV